MNQYTKIILTAVVASSFTLAFAEFLKDDNANYLPNNMATNVQQVSGSEAMRFVGNPDFSAIAERVTPAVVHIKSTVKNSGTSSLQRTDPFQDLFGDFFGGGRQYQMQPQPRQASGSGVIINSDGYIVTNNHVIEDADEVEVTLSDKRTFKAKIIGTDPTTDLAVIQIKADKLQPVSFGNSDQLKVGQWVLAVGNPFNLESTVTAGIVSAKGRNINILKENMAIESFIQTDAAVNPGNSGGALVNLNGELIGINTAIATPTGTYAGYSFAVPANLTSKVVEDLIGFGKVQRAVLGIMIRNLDGNLVKELNLDTKLSEGVYIDNFAENSAAQQAGLQKGDIIVGIDGNSVKSTPELQEIIARHRPGDKVKVMVERNGSRKEFTLTLRNMDGKTDLVKASSNEIIKALGVEFEKVSEQDLAKMGIESGVRIKRMYAGKLRSQTDIREGFVITKVNRQAVKSIEQLTSLLEKEKGGILIEGLYPNSPDVYYYGLGL